ncbi:hypothetical protein R9C00_06075 [Flammeovirgaceae bacterium SG7u.111]|nr:hypothetical protein [Flammeovirgaceae bacterium SG7u.132]WPO37008.1 hypothetical protein R9C00_06075 [Flammeovirgaceae bacterium SG7u.111]
MKNLSLSAIKALVVAMFLMSGMAVASPVDGKVHSSIRATSDFAYSIYAVNNSQKIRVAYEQSNAARVTVKIYDKEMNLIFTDVNNNKALQKRNYDMSKVGNGEYVVKIVAADYTTIHRVNVGSETKSNYSAFLPQKALNNKVRVAFQHATSPVRLSILNDEGKALYSKSVSAENFSNVFDMSTLNKGRYTIRISSGNDVKEQVYNVE